MKIFIANFGKANYLWPRCEKQATVATLEDEDLHPFWKNGDRSGYIAYALAHKKSAAGLTPTKPVASRWFNLATTIAETSDDLWIHREKDELWWTVSKPDAIQITLEPANEPDRTSSNVYIIQKPAHPWSNKDKKGRRLVWRALHPRACEFLFTEGTLQQLSEDNAAYAISLINGDDLSSWHMRPLWTAKEKRSRKLPVTTFSAAERAVFRMANTAMDTTLNANGQEVVRVVKNKEFRFDDVDALQSYLKALLLAQDNTCAITSLPLEFDGDYTDQAFLCSLDRIDSNGHYEPDNLQIICRFVNRWKSDSDNDDFLRLIRLVRGSTMPT